MRETTIDEWRDGGHRWRIVERQEGQVRSAMLQRFTGGKWCACDHAGALTGEGHAFAVNVEPNPMGFRQRARTAGREAAAAFAKEHGRTVKITRPRRS